MSTFLFTDIFIDQFTSVDGENRKYHSLKHDDPFLRPCIKIFFPVET